MNELSEEDLKALAEAGRLLQKCGVWTIYAPTRRGCRPEAHVSWETLASIVSRHPVCSYRHIYAASGEQYYITVAAPGIDLVALFTPDQLRALGLQPDPYHNLVPLEDGQPPEEDGAHA